ncbi:MAG: hypothetical protein COU27_02895 [Candidatus Levybacteria bacterium CG10_big_fil_rev_8_21_14_0_10_36_7]|nr:MAG: hypothetical protein COU27_02895 [Candidatus Levybacteria bacterium CG10_big_fil_rev_8_21_14_0_10_36_7]
MQELERSINCVHAVGSFLRRTHINVVPEVKKELKNLVYKVERKKNEFDVHKKSVIRSRRSHNFKFVNEFENIETVEEILFNEWYELTVAMFSEVCKSVYVPSNQAVYQKCEDLVCLIENKGKCRKPYKYLDCSENGLATDEKIIATALYRSFFENKSTAIVTGDDDFNAIFGNGIKHIFSKDIAFNTFFLEHFIFFPVNLYFIENGVCGMISRWDLIGGTELAPSFNLVNNPVENAEVKCRVDDIMRTLLGYTKNSN